MAGGKQQRTPTYLVVIYVVAMLLCGTLNTITTKIQLSMDSVGMDGETEQFRKPWYSTLNMLFAMSLVLLVEQCVKGFELCRPRKRDTMLMDNSDLLPSNGGGKSWGRKVCLVAGPAGFDLLATAFSAMGMLYIPASVWQILRGAALVFCALFSVMFLGRRLRAWNIVGIFVCVLGVGVVGFANVMSTQESEGDSDSDSGESGGVYDTLLGVSLVFLGQTWQAAQVIAEEWLMKDVDLPAMQIVGFEGIWGVLMMFVFIYPALYLIPGDDHGSLESLPDTVACLKNSHQLQGVVALYLVSCGTFNAAGIAVTGALNSVHRMMLDASRTTVIWAFGLYVYYQVDSKSRFGEEWTRWSPMQAAGFLILVTGQCIYGELLKLPCFTYPEPLEESPFASPASIKHLATPLPREVEIDIVEEQ